MNSGLNINSYSKDWHNAQSIVLPNSEGFLAVRSKENSSLNTIWRIVTAPLRAIAAIFSGIYSIGKRIFTRLCCKNSTAKASFKNEYQKLIHLHMPMDDELFSEARKHPYRNRYGNILPNEPTRFKIDQDPNFYFNANWVLEGQAIACQGPLESEISEFWKMVWESDIKNLVMLANPIEQNRKKCSEYWRAKTKFGFISTPYGNFHIKNKSEKTVFEKNNVKIIERTIQVSKGSENRIITQYHLQNWPDFGVVSPITLAELVKLVAQKTAGNKFLVHCSAGVGRTGTFLAAFQAFKKKVSSIFSIAADLRDPYKGRVGLIQTEKQYSLAKKTAQLLLN